MKKRYKGKPIRKFAFAVNKKYGFCTSLGVDRDSGEASFLLSSKKITSKFLRMKRFKPRIALTFHFLYLM
jgi:hypothetical protein